MKLLKEKKIELSSGNGHEREEVNQPYLKDGVLASTNGAIITVLHVETDDADTNGLVSIEALKMARKAAKKGQTLEIRVNGNEVIPATGATMQRPQLQGNSKFPDFMRIVPDKNKVTLEVMIDVTLLSNVADSLGTKHIKLSFIDQSSPILIHERNPTGTEGLQDFGVLLPMRFPKRG